VVSTGNPLFTVVDPASLRLEAQVPVAAAGHLAPGTRVAFTVDGFGDRQFEGRVARVNPVVDPATRQVRITVSLPNRAGRLIGGLFAQGRAAVESRSGVVVPAAAIDRTGLRPTVTRLAGGALERVEVGLGIEDAAADRVEVTRGLATGDTVVLGPARGLPPGTRARPAAPAERASASR
jgi:membrane fusion protein, multidrug efflux system